MITIALTTLAWAGTGQIVDTTPTTATADGAVNLAEYAGHTNGINFDIQYYDILGDATEVHVDGDDAGNLHIGMVSPGFMIFGSQMVIYIDSIPGGVPDTTPLVDGTSERRQSISGLGSFGIPINVFFAPGFEPDYAIAIATFSDPELYRIEAGLPHGG
jgi:hypothetical protein